MPEPDRMALGMIEQRRAVELGGVEVAGIIGQRTCALPEHAAKSQRVPAGAAFLDILSNDAQGLIGEALQPENARLEIMAGDPYIEAEADDLRPLRHEC